MLPDSASDPQRREPAGVAAAADLEPAVLLPAMIGERPALGHRGARAARVALLMASDLLALLVAGGVAYFAWALPVRHQHEGLYARLLPVLALFLLAYAQAGLYPGLGLGPVERLRRFSYATLFVFLVLAAASFAFKLPPVYSRVTFALALLLSLVLVPLGRASALARASRWRWWREPMILVGPPSATTALVRRIAESPALGYATEACLEPGAGADGGFERAVESAAARGVRMALIGADAGLAAAQIDLLQRRFHHVLVAGAFGELPVDGVVVRDLGGLAGLEYTNQLLVPRHRATKRVLDLAFASILLLLMLPVIAAAALAVLLVSPGWPFFVQRRSGHRGATIAVPKIRTMRPGADAERARVESEAGLAEEWRQHQKLRNDPRLVPGLGRPLRRFSIDELPQLWSVLTGDMSLVGPRPFPDYHVQQFTPEFRELRERVRPGITGLWQVTVRSEGGLDAQQALDTYYIRNWSPWLDIYILARTIGAVLSGRGAF